MTLLQVQPNELVQTALDPPIALKLQIKDLETGETRFHQIDLSPTILSPNRPSTSLTTTECSIGRDANCDLVLLKAGVSRRHAKIHREGKDYYFTDLGSLSGSYLNHVKLNAHQSEQLNLGSTIQINNFMLMVEEMIIAARPEIDRDSLATQIALPEEWELSPQVYMPVAQIEPSQFDRWHKGDLTVKCASIIDETGDAKTFRFVAEPPVLFSYQPGQFVTLNLEINGKQIARSYSISSTPSRPHTLEITVKRVPSSSPDLPRGLVSNWLHDHLELGSQVNLSGPMGKFTCFAHPSPKLLFLSAGSGITPMMGMSRWIYDTGADCDVTFFHSARTASDVIFRDELELLAARQNNFHLAISYTGTSGITGLKGRLTAAMLEVICPDFRDRVVFVCGSKGFMEGTKKMFGDLQFPMHNYHQESFGSPKKKAAKQIAPVIPVPTAPEFGLAAFLDKIQANVYLPSSPDLAVVTPPQIDSPAPTASIQVVFDRSGQNVVSDGEESILELAEQVGVKIRSGCRMGSCGACKKLTRSGTVQMTDPDALDPSEAAAGYILCCVAYPQDRVVVDA
jgi:glycine betaine catabolism B